jgi:hypothetical protein
MTAHDERFQPEWRKSTYSTNGGDCVEIAVSPGGEHWAARTSSTQALCMVRDSKDPGGPRLYFTPNTWTTFTRRMKDGTSNGLG